MIDHRKFVQAELGAFDPAAWLSQFREAGGWWIVGADDRVYFGWRTKGAHINDIGRASVLWREINADPAKMQELWDTLLSDSPWETDHESGPSASSRAFVAGAIHAVSCSHMGTTGADGMCMDIHTTGADGMSGARAAWESAIATFERAEQCEASFREEVFNPLDAKLLVGDPVFAAADRAMDQVNDVTDQARRVALRTPAPDGQALRWKLEQFLVEKVMPHPPAGEIEQIFADLDRLLAAGPVGGALATEGSQAEQPARSLPADQDAPLRAAWSLWVSMRDAYEAEPCPDCSQEELSRIEAPYWDAIGTVEGAIAGAKATTPEGVAIKIKLALDTVIADKDGGEALRHGRIDDIVTEGLEWNEKLLVDVLRDLSVMSERLVA